jgi:hypothetical protein
VHGLATERQKVLFAVTVSYLFGSLSALVHRTRVVVRGSTGSVEQSDTAIISLAFISLISMKMLCSWLSVLVTRSRVTWTRPSASLPIFQPGLYLILSISNAWPGTTLIGLFVPPALVWCLVIALSVEFTVAPTRARHEQQGEHQEYVADRVPLSWGWAWVVQVLQALAIRWLLRRRCRTHDFPWIRDGGSALAVAP